MKLHLLNSDHRTDLSRFAGLLVLLLVGGCASLQLASQWTDNSITIDGKNDDWAGKTSSIKTKKLTMGFANDTNFVYLMLGTTDRATSRMLMMRGLTIWFDSAGGRAKTFGVHYPLGLVSGGGGGGRETQIDPFGAIRGNTSMSVLEILGPGEDDVHKMQIAAAGGIQARVSYTESGFTYELKIPYAAGDRFPFSIHAKSGSVIGVGMETPEMGSGSGASGTSSGAGGGGGRGRGGRGGSSSMGSEPDRAQSAAEPIRDFMTVQLLSPDSVKAR